MSAEQDALERLIKRGIPRGEAERLLETIQSSALAIGLTPEQAAADFLQAVQASERWTAASLAGVNHFRQMSQEEQWRLIWHEMESEL